MVEVRSYSRISGAISDDSEIDRFWKRSATAAPRGMNHLKLSSRHQALEWAWAFQLRLRETPDELQQWVKPLAANYDLDFLRLRSGAGQIDFLLQLSCKVGRYHSFRNQMLCQQVR